MKIETLMSSISHVLDIVFHSHPPFDLLNLISSAQSTNPVQIFHVIIRAHGLNEYIYIVIS